MTYTGYIYYEFLLLKEVNLLLVHFCLGFLLLKAEGTLIIALLLQPWEGTR